MTKPYKLPLKEAQAEFVEKKSRFIANISPVASNQEALDFLRSIREKHPQASHNVYAYRIYSGGACRHSDDGEPSGTAGMPLLDVFLKQDIYDFCCVATRYYGGINLGAGGLIRAYANCGVLALETCGVGIMREVSLCRCNMLYPLFEPVKRLLLDYGADITAEDFGADVTLQFSICSEEFPVLQNRLVEKTAGKVGAEVLGICMAASTSALSG